MENNEVNDKLIYSVLIIVIIGMILYICYNKGLFNYIIKKIKTLNNNETTEKVETTEEENSNEVEGNYVFEFKNRCDSDVQNGEPYLNITSNNKVIKKLDGYQSYEEITINDNVYYLLSKNYCTDSIAYDLVLDSELNEVYSNEEFKLYQSSQYIVINKTNDNSVDLLDFDWKYQKSLSKTSNTRYMSDDYYLELVGNEYRLYDYDSNYIVTLFTKTNKEDLLVTYGFSGGIATINGKDIYYITTVDSNNIQTFYYYDFDTKQVQKTSQESFDQLKDE